MKKVFIPSLIFVFILCGFTNIFARETKRLNDQPNFQEQSMNLQSCVTLTLNLDNNPEQTSWSIVDANGIAVAGGSNYTSNDSTVVINECLPYGCYNFVIKDTAGDGICCAFGDGYYTLVDDATGNLLASGREFDSIKSTNFCLDKPTSCASVDLEISFDGFPNQTSWSIVDANGIAVAGGSNYTSNDSTVFINECLPYGCYNFVIKDTAGDGICCVSGNGSYTLIDGATGNILASGGDFGSSESTNFCLDDPTSCANVDLEIHFDNSPIQTSWDITDASGNVVASSGGNTYSSTLADSNLPLPDIACLPDGCYDLTFYDSANDGMCPRRIGTVLTGINITQLGLGGVFNGIPRVGSSCGNYTLTDANGTVLISGGGRFGTSETNNFCISSGLAEFTLRNNDWHEKTDDLRIRPNLVKNEMTVFYQLEEAAVAELYIIDINGKILQQHALNASDTQVIRFDVNELTSGFYFVQLVSGDVMMIEKFVKN